MVVIELAESHVAGETKQAPNLSRLVAVIDRQRCCLSRPPIFDTLRKKTDGTDTVLFCEKFVVVIDADAVL